MVGVAIADVVAILTRAPSSGGKTRLFAELGLPPDPSLLTALLLDTVDGASAAGPAPVIAVTPPSNCDEVARLVPRARVTGQADGDLGDRMVALMEAEFSAGAGGVALIGSDLPEITATHVASAFAILDGEPSALVLGPAQDGGYYLIAATRVPPVFTGVEWGGGHVLAQTRSRAAAAGWPVRLLPPLADVDEVADLRRVCAVRPGSRTAAWARATGRLKDNP